MAVTAFDSMVQSDVTANTQLLNLFIFGGARSFHTVFTSSKGHYIVYILIKFRLEIRYTKQ